MKLDDDARGQKVRCSNCNKSLNIPASNGKKQTQEDDEETIQEGRKLKTAVSKARENESTDEDRDDDRPKKKKKKKKAGAPVGLFVGIGVAMLLLVVGGGAAAAYYFMQNPRPQPIAQNNKKIEEPPKEQEQPRTPERIVVPTIKEGNPDKKGGTYIVSTVRGQGYRTERRNELKQIGLFFTNFCDGTPKTGRTKDAFLEFIKRDSKAIHEAIRDGYYVMNMNARMDSSSIIAYERDIDRGDKHLCVMGDCSVDYLPVQEVKDRVK
jgi:hypothetical protein